MALESNLHIDEILADLFSPDVKTHARTALQEYRLAALIVARLPISLEAKERKVRELQDHLHDKLTQLLKQDREGLPLGSRTAGR